MTEQRRAATGATLYALGYANVDVIARVARLPGDGDRVTSTGIDVRPGGMAANCACAAAQLGTPTQLLASIGRGGFAPILLDDLEARGVGTRYLHRVQRTTLAVITVTPDGQRSIISEPVTFDPARVDEALAEADAKRSLLYVDGYHVGWAAPQIARAQAAGFLVYCDLDGAPDTYRRDEVDASLRHVDVAQWNPAIAAAWLPDRSPEERQAWLLERVAAVVTTRGAGQVDVATRSGTTSFPVPPAQDVRDTTGAGDIFAGAMLHRLALGDSLAEAVPAAIAVAADSVMHTGARLPLPGAGPRRPGP